MVSAGLGFKTEHFEEAIQAREPGLWFEVHAENYMVDGGPRLAALLGLRERHPVSLHGVGLSLASVEPPSLAHLKSLRRLCDRVQPILVSDHLAWQKWQGAHHSDFLPFPRTREALEITVRNVERVQEALGRTILIENPSLYVDLQGHEMDEPEFLTELARRSGCRLLIDVNNLYVSARNLGCSPELRLDALPAELIDEIHLAGHCRDPHPGSPLLIDSHDAPIADDVWALYKRLIRRIGARLTLIERDDRIPPFAELMRERAFAHWMLEGLEPVHA